MLFLHEQRNMQRSRFCERLASKQRHDKNFVRLGRRGGEEGKRDTLVRNKNFLQSRFPLCLYNDRQEIIFHGRILSNSSVAQTSAKSLSTITWVFTG